MSFHGHKRASNRARSVGADIRLENNRRPASCHPFRSTKSLGEAFRDPMNDLPDFLRNALPNRGGVIHA